MPTLSPARANAWASNLEGLTLLHRGKVRDTYDLGRGRLLSVASDGVSIFDFVLNALVPYKGYVLTGLTLFWAKLLARYGINTHIITAGAGIDEHLENGALRGSHSLQARALVIRQLAMVPFEFVSRACLAGSGLKSYQATGEICGHKLPAGLQDGDELPYLLDTPTTKAVEGHDQAVDAAEIRARYPSQTYDLLRIFQIARSYARTRGIIIADTKFEFGSDGTLADEILTPDSSRFWDVRAWVKSQRGADRKAPPSLDKQLVREWGKSVGIDKLTDPSDPAQVAHVQSLQVPADVLSGVRQAYRYIFWRLTGRRLETFWAEEAGVYFPSQKQRLAIVVGSRSDLPAVTHAVHSHGWESRVQVHVASCHRNPSELLAFVKDGCGGATAVIAAAGMAAALPGVLDALIRAEGRCIPVIGVALGEEGTAEFQAARLSIEQLPGQPVVLKEDGTAYSGASGIKEAMERLETGELPPPPPRVAKPAEFNVTI